jgi:NTE family protein
MADSCALVLGGGAVKGAFQVGALRYVLGEYGFQPSIIYGTSVGALNGAFLADRAGRVPKNKEPDWKLISEELWEFWERKITKPRDIIKRRWALGVAWDILIRRFRGIVDPSPLHQLVRQEINVNNLSRVKYSAGTVDVSTGSILYTDMMEPAEKERLVEYIIASTSIPIAMPIKDIERKLYYDGCLVDVAPVNKAIRAGASRIITIACQSERVANQSQEDSRNRDRNLLDAGRR